MNLKTEWNNIGELLESAAAKHGPKPFFIFKDETFSFAYVNDHVNRLANGLVKLGLSKGDRVGVMLPNGVDFPISWMAIGKTGGIMVPVNIGYKEYDLEYVLADSGARFIILHSDFLEIFEKIKNKLGNLSTIIVVGSSPREYLDYYDLIARSSGNFTGSAVSKDDLVNIQYTSGTTGFPKGCMLTHGYWLLLGKTSADYTNLRENDVDMTAQPFFYMDPQWNTILCMLGGIPLVIMEKFSVTRFWPTVKKNNVTFFYVIGTMPFYLLKQAPNPELEQQHNLRVVMCSGIVPSFHETFEKRWNVPWREAFGMTETGVDLLVPIDDTESVGSGAMGAPVPTKKAKIIDTNGHELNDGQVGELVLSGQPMMLGYWNKPKETAVMIEDGWLHTGDLAYKDAKGYYHWTGRLKDMVRRTGENISSVEVESVLMEHAKIKIAAVVPVPDELRGEEVKVYVILTDGETKASFPPESILEFAASKLARFKLPRYIEYVSDLPKTPSEKIAKHVLISEKSDLRSGSYDAEDKLWR